MEFNTIVLIACTLLLTFTLIAEWRRADRSRLVWRLLANFIAIACFALLIVPITYQSPYANKQNEAVLITDGTDFDSIAQLQTVKYQLGAENSLSVKRNKASAITDFSYFLATHPQFKKFDLYGYGLSEAELNLLKGRNVKFHPSPAPEGIVAVNWPAKITPTMNFNIQGTYHNGKKATKLIFKGLGSSIDSLELKPNATRTFNFNAQPKQLGKAIYELIALQNGDTISRNPVPFEVLAQTPMKVLILASFPDFEYKFLKRWLFDQYYPLAFRSQISKDKFTTDFLNMEGVNLSRISSATLQKFDALIIDEEELSAISANERSAIENAVTNGLGLLIRVSAAKASNSLSNRSARYETAPSKEKTLSLTINQERLKLSPLALTQTIFLKTAGHQQAIISDKNGQTLATSQINGAGKIVLSAIAATYNWALAGKKNDYTSFWSTLLAETARKKKDAFSVQMSPKFPVVQQQIRVIVNLNETNSLPRLKTEENLLSPRQNMELPFEWDAFFWPMQQGWQELQVNEQSESYFVYQKSDWLALKQQQQRLATLHFSRTANINELKSVIIDQTITKEVGKWWFFVGFLLAAGYLWYEQRILKQKS